MRENRALSRIEDMIRYPIAHTGEDAREVFREGLQLFQGLTDIGKYKVMRELAKDLSSIRSFVFESEHETRKLTVVATFFAEAATLLPKNEFGDTLSEPYQDIIHRLRDVAENNTHYDSNNEAQTGAKIACLHAIWNLGDGHTSFWVGDGSGPLTGHDLPTKLASIGIFLAEPFRENVSMDEHPWSVLREHLGEIGIDILRSPFEKKYEFFYMMLSDEDPAIVRKTLEILYHAPHLPPHFFIAASQIAEHRPDFTALGNMLQTVVHLNAQLTQADNSQFEAARHLLMIYQQNGMGHMVPLLQEVGQEMVSVFTEPACSISNDRETRRSTLVSLGIKMPGSGLPSPSSDVTELDEFKTADEETLDQLSPQHLIELTKRIWGGRSTITPEEEEQLDRIGAILLVKFRQIEEKQKALAVLISYSMAGIQVSGFRFNLPVRGGSVQTQRGYESLSIPELFEIWEKEHSKLWSDPNNEGVKAVFREISPVALSRSQNLDNLGLEDLRRLYLMVRGGRTDSPEYTAALDHLAQTGLALIKKDGLLQIPRPDIVDAPNLEEAARAFNRTPFTDISSIQATNYECRRISDYLHIFLSHVPERGDQHE
ncbi:Uncharacterised protein [Candidatus Bilamarchaeum dharawalense]|uniref:Uncharacterized protein n=1 Tax=Candidatus Bilamarchaeum dharawalense TaxID=2885759 RepID=A0A5E4LS50_9ARCH|nr:Uncharacterised protein [Candidatus Bilamarchaeum dharawalense]